MISHVSSGDRLRTQPLNKVVDAANAFLQGRGADFPKAMQSGAPIFVLNKTGRAMLYGEVAPYKLEEAMPYPDTPGRMLQGTVAALREPVMLKDWSNWTILGESVVDGKSGYAYDSGVVLARVRPLDGDPEYEYVDLVVEADPPTEAWYHLKRVAMGPGRLLWLDSVQTEPGSGAEPFYWGLVRFGGHDQYPILYEVTEVPGSGDFLIAKRVDSAGQTVGMDEHFLILPEGS